MRKVKGHDNLVKTSTGAVVSTNMRQYQEVMARRRKEEAKDEKISDLETRLAKMEALVEKLTNGNSKSKLQK